MERDALVYVLGQVRSWQPFDGGAFLEDVGDDLMPHEEDVEDLAQRLRGHLMQLARDARPVAEWGDTPPSWWDDVTSAASTATASRP